MAVFIVPVKVQQINKTFFFNTSDIMSTANLHQVAQYGNTLR